MGTNKMSLPIFIDIDGTLTKSDKSRFGDVHQNRIDKVNKLILSGYLIIIWSAGGDDYAKLFCKKHGINPHAAIGKPQFCVDDNPTIRPVIEVKQPEYLD